VAKRTTKKAPKTYDLRTYVQEATKAPFDLLVDDDTTISVPAPSVRVILELAKVPEDEPLELLELFVGDSFEDLFDAIGDCPAGVFEKLLEDLRKHFGLGE
jgi:hypothetical protein